MPATILDGKATAAAIRDEPTRRLAAPATAGHRPGLGHAAGRGRPGSRWFVLDVVGAAGHVAPDPGGVGPMTRAVHLQDVVLATERAATPSGRP